MHMTAIRRLARAYRSESGFTMMFVIGAMLVGGLLLTAAFTAALGDAKQTHKTSAQSKAYYAVQAGIQRYEYELSHNPNYWIECPTVALRGLPETADNGKEAVKSPEEEYIAETLPAKNHEHCEKGVQASVLETSGPAAGSFRIIIRVKAAAGAETTPHAFVATFTHPGFTKYVYESNYEVEDPANFSPEPTGCEKYHEERVKAKLTSVCPPIQFAAEDKVNGPMHTNDAADICAEGTKQPVFGRKEREDAIEMLQGHYSEGSGCKNEPNILGKYTESAEPLLPPETDAELLESADYKFKGRTVIVLKEGSPNSMTVTSGGTTTTKAFPENGVIYVENSSSGCAVAKYSPFNSDTVDDTGCGNVYVSGTYTESLTIASADDVIINGNLTTTGGSKGGEPTGGAELGLIAENFVRVYHPVKQGYTVEHYEPKYEVANASEIEEEECGTIAKLKGSDKTTKKEITGLSSTTQIATGMTVTGAGIPSGTTVTAKTSTTVTLSSSPTKNETNVEFVFFKAASNGYEYFAIKRCVEPPKSGYTFNEGEFVDTKTCESKTTTNGTFCEYENTSSTCSSKATNLNASEDPNKWGVLDEPIIDAAILSTKHSWIVDNYKCGAKLGNLTVWGSIAQFWRGPVGTGGGTGSGYIKNYNYDQRLFTKEPPNFLSPISTSWKLTRETEVPCSYGEPAGYKC